MPNYHRPSHIYVHTMDDNASIITSNITWNFTLGSLQCLKRCVIFFLRYNKPRKVSLQWLTLTQFPDNTCTSTLTLEQCHSHIQQR